MVALEKIMTDSKINTNNHRHMAFANDVILIVKKKIENRKAIEWSTGEYKK